MVDMYCNNTGGNKSRVVTLLLFASSSQEWPASAYGTSLNSGSDSFPYDWSLEAKIVAPERNGAVELEQNELG